MKKANSITSFFLAIKKYSLTVLFGVFIFIQLFLFFRFGVLTSLEAAKYIEQGNLLFSTGHLSDAKYVLYLPVILLVYLCKAVALPIEYVVIPEIIISGISLYFFYKLVKKISSHSIAFISAFLLAVFTPLQSWNLTLYSDSIFISSSIIFTYVVFVYKDRKWTGLFLMTIFLSILLFSRPHGILFIPPIIIYLILRRSSRIFKIVEVGYSFLLLFVMYQLLNYAFTGGGDMDAMKPFIEEHIICFVPEKPAGAILDTVKTANPVHDLFYYVTHNPLHFLRLMFLKLGSFFNLTRPYYSAGHNLLLLVYMLPLYIGSIFGLVWLFKTHRNFSIFVGAVLILYPLGATFQCDDWHSRFTMVVFPYFIVLGCIGISNMSKLQTPTAAP